MAGKNEQEVSAYSFEAYVDEVKVVAMNTTEFSSKVFDSLTRDWLDGRKLKPLCHFVSCQVVRLGSLFMNAWKTARIAVK